MKATTASAVAALLAAFTLLTQSASGQKNAVPFPRDQIALQLGAIQMGYVVPPAAFVLPAAPDSATMEQAANAMAQGRIALANTAGRGTVNVNNAPNLPADVAAFRIQLDDAVQAVMASPGEGRIKGRVTLSNGKSRGVTAKLSPPLPDWSVPLPYAISSLTGGLPGPVGPQGPPGPQGPAGITGGAGVGTNNSAAGSFSFVGGGINNRATTNFATVTAGSNSLASGPWSFIGGGRGNIANNDSSTVAGGRDNATAGDYATVGGGRLNAATGLQSTVAGGFSNNATGTSATIGGGEQNTASGFYSIVGGGINNTASDVRSTVSGGMANTARGRQATVSGGQGNTASGIWSTIGGGFSNNATGSASVVSGGAGNTATGSDSVVSGGTRNTASGPYSTVPGGVRALATNNGTFVWSGADTVDTVSTNANSFTVRAPGGVRFITTTATNNLGIGPGGTNGVAVAPGGTAWTTLSDSNAKTAVEGVNPRAVLAKLEGLPVSEWEYKHDPERRYFGPMSQDFHAAFGLGRDDKTINTLDADGVLFLSVKGLIEEIKLRDKAIEELKAKLESVEQRLESFPPAP